MINDAPFELCSMNDMGFSSAAGFPDVVGQNLRHAMHINAHLLVILLPRTIPLYVDLAGM
jgi:hypothetical protein